MTEPISAEAQETAKTISLLPVRISRLEVPIVGVTPLIVHAWSEKAREMMASAKGVRQKKEARDPDADYEASRYLLPDGTDGFPAVAFKAAMVDAARLFEGVTMVQLKTALFVEGVGPNQLVPIIGAPSRREDMVRVGMGVADIRWRAQFEQWAATLTIEFIPSVISPSSIVSLVNAAGIGGVGEWRPSSPKGKTGTYGRFRIGETTGIKEISRGNS